MTQEMFADWDSLNSLLMHAEPVFPPSLIHAKTSGAVFHTDYARRVMPHGKLFRAPLAAFESALCEAGFRLCARFHTDDGIRRLYCAPDGIPHGGASFVRADEGTRGGEVVALSSDFIGMEDLRATWEGVVQRFAVTPEAAPSGTPVYVLATSPRGGYELKSCGRETSALIEENYTPGVAKALASAARDLASAEPPGRLLLLDGPPGTGKTRAVRAVIGAFGGAVRVVIIPAHLVADLAGPDLLGTLLGANQPTVLVVEDADYALLDREERSGGDRQGATGALASILNLSDGILGAQIDLRLVATTNASVTHLDAAVLRPGRLLARIHLGALDPVQARAVVIRVLASDLAMGTVTEAAIFAATAVPMTLAEAYAAAAMVRAGALEAAA